MLLASDVDDVLRYGGGAVAPVVPELLFLRRVLNVNTTGTRPAEVPVDAVEVAIASNMVTNSTITVANGTLVWNLTTSNFSRIAVGTKQFSDVDNVGVTFAHVDDPIQSVMSLYFPAGTVVFHATGDRYASIANPSQAGGAMDSPGRVFGYFYRSNSHSGSWSHVPSGYEVLFSPVNAAREIALIASEGLEDGPSPTLGVTWASTSSGQYARFAVRAA